MGNEDTTKRLDSSQEALDHMEHNSLAADEVISDLIRDIWGKDPNAEPPEAESSAETQADSSPESGEVPAEAPQEPESPEEPEEPEEPADPADSEKAEEPESSAAPEAPEQPQALTSGAISAAMAAQPDPDASEDRSDSWYHYGEDDQELEEEAEPLPEPPQKLRKKKRRKRRRHPVLSAVSHGLLVFLTVFSLAYLVAVYSDIPLVTRVRTMYIQSAMNTLNHKWMATAIIPGSIIDSVMRTQYEAAEAAMGVESNWGAVEVQELPVLEAPVIVPAVLEDGFEVLPDSTEEQSTGVVHESDSEEDLFFGLFWELDRSSFKAYLEEHPGTLDNGWYGININEAGLDDAGTSIETIHGDQVLAVNAKDGIILIRVWLSENQSRGILAICKDTSRLSLCPADTLGVIGQTAGRICESNGGILAITGSAFIDPEGVGNGGEISGLAVCSGKVFGSRLLEDSKRLELRNDNRMYIMDSASELGEGTRDACEFQPAMIVDGTILDTTWNGLEPRAVLGQSEKLETMMVILEGRYADSLGCGVEYVAAKMRQYGCVQAMNLDGGTSAIMYYDGEYVTRCSNPDLPGGRTLPTAWVYKPAY